MAFYRSGGDLESFCDLLAGHTEEELHFHDIPLDLGKDIHDLSQEVLLDRIVFEIGHTLDQDMISQVRFLQVPTALVVEQEISADGHEPGLERALRPERGKVLEGSQESLLCQVPGKLGVLPAPLEKEVIRQRSELFHEFGEPVLFPGNDFLEDLGIYGIRHHDFESQQIINARGKNG